jgi:hypothetical protein
MEQSFAVCEGIGLTKSDPAFFDAAIVAQVTKKEAEASFLSG